MGKRASMHVRERPPRDGGRPEGAAARRTDRTCDQGRLLAALLKPAVYGDGVRRVTVLETHISYVLLTGQYAYKIKKAVDLEFLDFTAHTVLDKLGILELPRPHVPQPQRHHGRTFAKSLRKMLDALSRVPDYPYSAFSASG